MKNGKIYKQTVKCFHRLRSRAPGYVTVRSLMPKRETPKADVTDLAADVVAPDDGS